MSDMNFTEMQQMQRVLQEKYLEKWGGLSPEMALSKMLWLHGELGEASDVMKKNGSTAILDDPAVRRRFVEELCDALMYFNDVLLCYGVTPEELTEIYTEKFRTNMSRW